MDRRKTTPIVYRRGGSQKNRASATWTEVAPIFDTVIGTRALAIVSGIGPLTRRALFSVRPGMNKQIGDPTLKKYAKLGLLIRHQLAARGRPAFFALNKKHAAYTDFERLTYAIWKHQVEPALTRQPVSAADVPALEYHAASESEEVYRNHSRHGEILHLLSEFDGPIEQIAACELLGKKPSPFHDVVSRLVTFGLVSERYVARQRFIQINEEHPVASALRTWLRYVNATFATRYVELREQYIETKVSGGYDRVERMRRKKISLTSSGLAPSDDE